MSNFKLQVLKYFCDKYGLYFKLHDEKIYSIFRIRGKFNEHVMGNVKTEELNSMDTNQIEDFVLQCVSGKMSIENFKTLQVYCNKYGLVVYYNMLDRLYRIYDHRHPSHLKKISEELLNTMEESKIEEIVVECVLERMG